MYTSPSKTFLLNKVFEKLLTAFQLVRGKSKLSAFYGNSEFRHIMKGLDIAVIACNFLELSFPTA